MKRETRDIWAQRVTRWRESGLTAREFAGEIGVNANSLSAWASKLKATGAQDKGPRRRQVEAPSKQSAGVGWVEVVAATRAPAARATASTVGGDDRFELVLGGARLVRVPTNFDADALRRLLAVVEVS